MKPQNGRDESAKAPSDESAPPSGPASIAQAIGTRNLLIIIVTMPLVFVVVVLATLAVFGKPGDGRQPADAATASAYRSQLAGEDVLAQAPLRPAQASLDAAAIVAPAGARVSALAMDGDRLAVTLDTAQGPVIVVYDLTRGMEIRRIQVATAR